MINSKSLDRKEWNSVSEINKGIGGEHLSDSVPRQVEIMAYGCWPGSGAGRNTGIFMPLGSLEVW